MKFNLKQALVRRFIEILVSCTVLSATVTVLNIYKVLTEQKYLLLALSAGAVLFLLLNMQMQRHYYFDALGNKLYYFATLIPYGVFALLSIAAYYINYKVYVLLFSITKFLRYYDFSITNEKSIVVFHVAGFLVMSLSFIGLDDVIKSIKTEIADSMILPNGLKMLELNTENNSAEDKSDEKKDTVSDDSASSAENCVGG